MYTHIYIWLRSSSRVSRPSSCYSSTAIWSCCKSTLLQTSHPKLVPYRAEDNKLSSQARKDSSVVSCITTCVSLHPISNSFQPQNSSLVRMRS